MIPAVYATITLLTAIASFIVGGFILIKRFRSPLARIWFFLCLAIGGWNLGYYFTMLEGINKDLALLASRVSHANGILITVLFFHFALIFLKFTSQKRLQLILAYLSCSVLAALSLTSFVVTDLVPKLSLPYYPVGKMGYAIYVAFFIFWIVYAYYLMFKHYKHLSGYKRNQLKYFLTGTILGFSGGATCFPLIFGFPLAPYASSLIFIYPFTTTYAIVKYRLMDITLVWRQVLIFAAYFVAACALAFLPMGLGYQYPVSLGIIMAVFLFIAPFVYRLLNKFSQPFIDDVLLGGKYNYWRELRKFWEKKGVVYTSSQLASVLVRDVSALMNLENCSFFLFERDRKVFVPLDYVGLDDVFDHRQAQFLNTMHPDDPLILRLKKKKKIIMRDDMDTEASEKERRQISVQMDEIKARISVPLFVTKRLAAVLNLGPKKGGEMFHKQDIELLEKLVAMTERHLSHIAFLENSLFFSGNVAHDIRNPFKQGIIYDYILDIRKGLESQQGKQVAMEALADLESRLRSLHGMSEVMVNVYESLDKFLSGQFKPERINYNRKIEEVSKPHKKKAADKGLILEADLPKEDVFVYAEPLAVERILDELLTNAIRYTNRGKVIIRACQENPQEILTEVADTGCGIPEEDLEQIWELFRKAASNPKSRQKSTGIGLASVRQLVEANGGRIWVNKSEVGKGSSFCIPLPAEENRK